MKIYKRDMSKTIIYLQYSLLCNPAISHIMKLPVGARVGSAHEKKNMRISDLDINFEKLVR